MYLFDEQPIVANKTLARELGLIEALVLQQINYRIEINKKSEKNYHDGKYWTYNSIRAWQENDFGYMSFDTVKRTFSNLEKVLTKLEEKRLIFSLIKKYSTSRLQKKHFLKGYLQVRG